MNGAGGGRISWIGWIGTRVPGMTGRRNHAKGDVAVACVWIVIFVFFWLSIWGGSTAPALSLGNFTGPKPVHTPHSDI